MIINSDFLTRSKSTSTNHIYTTKNYLFKPRQSNQTVQKYVDQKLIELSKNESKGELHISKQKNSNTSKQKKLKTNNFLPPNSNLSENISLKSNSINSEELSNLFYCDKGKSDDIVKYLSVHEEISHLQKENAQLKGFLNNLKIEYSGLYEEFQELKKELNIEDQQIEPLFIKKQYSQKRKIAQKGKNEIKENLTINSLNVSE